VAVSKSIAAFPAGDLPGGIKLYERALAHNAQHADAWYNMGVAWVEAGDAHRAIYCYELAVHFNPHCAEAHNNLGTLSLAPGCTGLFRTCRDWMLTVGVTSRGHPQRHGEP